MWKIRVAFVLMFFIVCKCLAGDCIPCHVKITPNIVNDWELSLHNQNDIFCSDCHGSQHKTLKDFGKVKLPTPETCAECHEDQVTQFKKGKHAFAWTAMKVMPTTHQLPMALREGMQGCGGCHKIGLKTETEIKELKENGVRFGIASCDACHTRHIFSKKEAKQPQACQTCHMGFDHPQWEMYSSSKHGVRALLKQNGILQSNTSAPTCQTCHMQEGNHEVRTSWGFLAVRLPLSDDLQWKKDQITILQALGVLDLKGNSTDRFEVIKENDVIRLSQKTWQEERDKMISICNQCHSVNFVRMELEKGDQIIKEADHLLAEAIRIVASLYKDNIIKKPENYEHPFPDLLKFHDAPTIIEQRLFEMHLKHRMRTFQGIFHANPDYALWYGWSEMKRDLTKIKTLASELRDKNI